MFFFNSESTIEQRRGHYLLGVMFLDAVACYRTPQYEDLLWEACPFRGVVVEHVLTDYSIHGFATPLLRATTWPENMRPPRVLNAARASE